MAKSKALAIKAQVGDLPADRTGTKRSVSGVDPIIAEARERWKRSSEAEEAQRKSILGAKMFRAGDQWPEAVKTQREGAQAIQGQAAQPPRPCLTIDRLSQPARQLSNQIKQAQFTFDVQPNGFGADTDTAAILKGYFRRVQDQARSEGPMEWAADGAIEGGLGWVRLRTEYVHENWTGDPNDPAAYDQEPRLERIANNLSVYDDPSASKPTRTDSRFRFIVEDMDRDEFKSRWPDADLDSLEDFASTGNDMLGWVTKDTIRVSEYWRVNFTDKPIESEKGQKRIMRVPDVEGFKINATQVLEKWKWAGSNIPQVPVLGEELNIDGRQVLRGIIQEGMDAQRMVNYTYSGAMEIFALAPKSPWVVAAGQVDSYKEFWQVANTFNLSYLPYDPVAVGGELVGAPQRQDSEPPIQAAVALMLKSEEAIKATTGVYDPSLEYNNPQEHSGTAIQSLQQQSDIGASNYPLNVQRAWICLGEMMIEIAPKIIRPGQVLQIIGADDAPEQVIVGHPFEPGGPGQPPKPLADNQPMVPDLHQFYDLTKGQYAVTVTVGKATATKREEGVAALGQIIPHLNPEQQAVVMPDYVEQMSFPGAHKIAEKLRKTLPPQLQDEEAGGPNHQLMQAQQQIQQLQQQLQSKVAEKQAEVQAKGQIDLQKTTLQEQAENQRTQQQNQVEMSKAELQATTTLGVAQAKIDAENFRSYVDALETKVSSALDLHMHKLTQIHDALTTVHQTQHEASQAALDRTHEAQMAVLQHQQTLEQGQQDAALQPEPTGDQNAGE